MKNKIILFLGPVYFVILSFLLLCKTAALIHQPIWMGSFFLSILLSTWITFLSCKEVEENQRNLQDKIEKENKQVDDLKGILDETHRLYREKIEKLEVTIAEIEAGDSEKLSEKEQALIDLQTGYHELHEEAVKRKNQISALQRSLDDALDLVRDLRQREYLQKEYGNQVPEDLINEYTQLRRQFTENSHILDEVQKALFEKDGELVALKKDWEALLQDEHAESFFELFFENQRLYEEIFSLEEVISKLLEKKSKKAQKKSKEMLDLQLELNNFEKKTTNVK